MGVGATKRLNAVKWGVAEQIVFAWILTLPVTGLLGALFIGLSRLG
jgi:PiT family inorganic phosphate transporter